MTIGNDILVVDKDIDSLQKLVELLKEEGYAVRPAETAQAALEMVQADPPGLILIDFDPPEKGGFGLCQRLKQDERTMYIPVIFITPFDNPDAKFQSFEAGGDDVLAKPLEEKEVLARVGTHLQLRHLQQSLGEMAVQKSAEIRESESRFTYLVENANEAIVVAQDASIKYCNPKISELTGYSPEEMYSLSFDAFIHPEDLEMAMNEYRSRLSGERPKNSYAMRLIDRDGREVYTFVNSVLINWDGEPATLAMATDITEQKLAERGKIKSEKRFRRLMEQSPLDIIIMTPEGQIRDVNAAWYENWDVDVDEAEKIMAAYNMRTDSQFVDSGLAPLIEKGFTKENVILPPLRYIPSRIFEEIGLDDIEARERWIQTHIYPIKDSNGSIESVVCINMDITDLKRAEAEVIQKESKFRDLVDQSPMPVEILSPEGKILQVNSSWLSLWNISETEVEEAIDKYNMITDPQLKNMGLDDQVKRAFSGQPEVLPPVIYDANQAANDFDIKIESALKSPWIQSHLHPIKDNEGQVVNIVNTYVDVSDLKQAESELREAFQEIKELKDRLEAESAYLREEIRLEHNFDSIVGNSAALKYTLNRVEQVAPTDTPVLITGETGTGKELIARALHELSPRKNRPLVKVNCAALPAELIESELFGREKGAFTGAANSQAGRFEVADGSTLFLDEIGELPTELQAKLLRVLDSGEFERLGSTRTRHSNARIIAATNRELEEEVQENRFREDLWFRLKVFPITVPPLRDRSDDIPMLARFFTDHFSKKMGKPIASVTIRTMKLLQQYHWPGNIRELKHAIEGACISTQGRNLQIDLPQTKHQQSNEFQPFAEMERDYIIRVLEAKNWKIGGANSAASTLGMHVNTLRGRMKKLGIKRN